MEALPLLPVWVIDCQTTGASPAYGSVLEIGWGLASAESPELRSAQTCWVALPEGERVSARVRQLTGYDEASAAHAHAAEQVWQRLRASMGHAARVPVAIHFAQFELAFLRDWASRFEPEQGFPLDVVCLHAIAARLHPDLPRQSLRALAGYLGHGIDLERRCAPHVEASAFIWHKLAGELGQRGVHTWQELEAWLRAPRPKPSGKRRFPLPSARYRSLPDAPGVYHFLRANGSLLYVGKAASLKKRVSGHYTAGAASTPRALEMLSQIHDLRVTVVPTALEAALLENEQIKVLAPLYNLQLTHAGPSWFADARLASVARAPDAEHACGPLPSTFSVRALGAIRELCAGAEPTRTRVATALETRERWAPEPPTFEAGFAAFVQRHALAVPEGACAELRRRLPAAAHALALAPRAPAADDAGSAPADEDAGPESSAPGDWDAERVLRHLERALCHGQQLLERARWLCLLCDSRVEFREPGSERVRLLQLHGAELLEASDAPAVRAPLAARARPLRERQLAFERSHYDRLRTLTTELKRVQRDGGSVAVCVAGTRWLEDAAVRRLLRWV